MNVYYNIEDVPYNQSTVITIGTFDGIHRGHQQILKKLKNESVTNGRRPIVITFEPHPQIIVQRKDKPELYLLTTIHERLELFEHFGVENVLVIDFTYEFSKSEPEEFIENLHKSLGFDKILVGYDHNFGKDRKGNVNTLISLSQKLGFEVEKCEPFYWDNNIVSSTLIRNLLKNGELEKANDLLSYNYIIEGKVQYGRGMGAQLGYPTANIKPENIHKLYPKNGVYLVYSIIDDVLQYGIANIGIRPTLTNDTKPTLEVYYLDFDGDLYERKLRVTFLKYLREEIKFANTDELVNQIRKDERTARKLIKQMKNINHKENIERI
mgnify:CR=1 FL=1